MGESKGGMIVNGSEQFNENHPALSGGDVEEMSAKGIEADVKALTRNFAAVAKIADVVELIGK